MLRSAAPTTVEAVDALPGLREVLLGPLQVHADTVLGLDDVRHLIPFRDCEVLVLVRLGIGPDMGSNCWKLSVGDVLHDLSDSIVIGQHLLGEQVHNLVRVHPRPPKSIYTNRIESVYDKHMAKEEERIPKLSAARLKALALKIRPIVRNSKKVPHYIKPVDLKNQAFTWDPKLEDEARDLEPIKQIRTLHSYGYHGFFKPSIAEVLAFIPPDLADEVVAFEIVGSPNTADDFYKDKQTQEDFEAGYHTAQTVLYRHAPEKRPTAWERVEKGEL